MTKKPESLGISLKDAGLEGNTVIHDQDPLASDSGAEEQWLIFWYRNYKGAEGMRRVRPLRIRFGSSEWHPEDQWLMLAYDLENNKEREFAMRDMSGFVGNRDIELGFVVPPRS
jgi:hypothetical protein